LALFYKESWHLQPFVGLFLRGKLPSELSGVLVILVVLIELSRILTVVIELPGMLIVAILEGVLIAVNAPRSLKKPYVPLVPNPARVSTSWLLFNSYCIHSN